MYAVMVGHGVHCRDRTNAHYDAVLRAFLNAIIRVLRDEPGFDVPGADSLSDS